MIKIDKNVAVPAVRLKCTDWPFNEMEVGDSFQIPDGIDRYRLTYAASQNGKRTGKKFSVRKYNGTIRCWRIK